MEPAVQIGCQTNAWRIADFPAFAHALERIRFFGFDGFETSFRNIANLTRTQVEQTGLQFFGVHIFLLDYDPETLIAPEDRIRSVADAGRELGAGCLILSGASAGAPATLGRKADALNRVAASCGLPLAYHNHPHEFHHEGAEIEQLIRETDGEKVKFVLDAGHVHLAGGDALAFFARHHRRISALHLRDFAGPEQVPLGSGWLDLPAWAATIGQLGWRGWALAEEERPNDGRPGDEAVGPASTALRRTFRGSADENR
jgi:sugar phosphate isomerase/epimerase